MSTNVLQKAFLSPMFKKKVPTLKPGMTIAVHQRIKEGEKQRVQIFQGLVIKLNSGFGADKTFTVRKVFQGIGVEKIYPLYSPNLVKIEILKQAKVRRAKLYYMRTRFGKAARLTEKYLHDEAYQGMIDETSTPIATEVAPVVEEVKEEKK